MTSKLAVLLSVLLAVPFIAAPIIIQSGAAPPAGNYFYDDFADNLDDWTHVGWTPAVSSEQFTETGNGASIYDAGSNTNGDGYACVTLVSVTDYPGIMFRANVDATNRSYVVRVEVGNSVKWRYCLAGSCSDIESDTQTVNAGEHLAVKWTGTSDSTVVDWYVFAGGVGCSGCTGAGCDTSGWAAAARISGQFTNSPPGCPGSCTYPELGTNRYGGLYNGGSSTVTFDDFYFGDD